MAIGKQTIIRASEINTYLYCKRAWWYQRTGKPSKNTQELIEGSKLHYRHGQVVLISSLLRYLGWIFLLAAIIMAVISFFR